MQKINEQELENIIRDVINEEMQESVGGGLKAVGKQLWSDLKNTRQNLKRAYEYGSQAQDINKKYPAQKQSIQSTTEPKGTQPKSKGGNAGNPTTQTPTAQMKQGTQPNNTNQGSNRQQAQQQRSNRQADFRINPMRVSQGNRMIKQTIQQLIANYGLNFEQVYNALVNAANDVKKNRNEYFPQTNESKLSDERMDRLTEEIVTRIKKD